MASAKPDPTVPEVLTGDQIKTLSRPVLIEFLRKILYSRNRDSDYEDETILNRDIENIYDNEEVPNDVPLDAETKKEIKDFIGKTIKKTGEDFKEALASLEPFNYHAITFNMNGSQKKGVREHRRDMISIILRNVVPGVVFCQERPGNFEEKVVVPLTTKQQWEYVWTESEAGVIWNTDHFTGRTTGFHSTDRRMTKLRDKLIREGKPVDPNLLSRASFVKLTSASVDVQDNPRSFIAVSYHGPWTIKDLKGGKRLDKQNKMFQGLIEFVRKLCEEEGNIPFLIGGDFNFDTVNTDALPNSVVSPKYEMTPRAEGQKKIPNKDNFIWESTKPIKMTHIRPFVFGSGVDCDLSSKERSDVEKHPDAVNHVHDENVDDLLDHDPIIGIIELEETIIGNLAEKFKKLLK